ncbi:MAG: response regulator [Deltaproteobacteria bacterium]|nr:response regulator [Deltaproteobacteria bacterium]MBW2171963.1 response regulator [Deltaproteobacteria bacterium]
MKRTKREDDEALPRILIVDDEDTVCRLYAEELMDEGHNVITTTDGGGLLEIIEHQKSGVIVLDIKVGIYDGLDLLQDIRKARLQV